ncbi:hypothetical protein OG814_32090 [Streptomyces zaomyceticus]|uniref:Nucleotidyltransferase n=1 Tax=Streptomyces zaomyceticus TaxID=68286 RepID=A0ABZ1LJD2_9ACTN
MRGEIIGRDEAGRIHERLGRLVESHVPDAVVAFTSGSLPYGAAVRGHSDIDVNIMLPPGTRADQAFFDCLSGFIDDYSGLHEQHGMRLDRRYPGEYLTVDQALDAAAGRGVPVINGRPMLPRQLGDSYWNTTEETWYLAWMGALAFSRHVVGNTDVLTGLRRQAWATVAALCLPDLTDRDFRVEDVVARVLDQGHPSGGFGVHPGYRRFAELETPHCRQALADLAARAVLGRRDDGSVFVEREGLLRWGTDLADRHQAGFHAAPLLTVTSSLRLAV